jgi:hypothetical protein
MTSKNKVMQTCTPWTVVFRSWLMSLIMTFMFEPAKLQMNWARASGSSILRSAAAGSCTAAALVMTLSSRRSRPEMCARRSDPFSFIRRFPPAHRPFPCCAAAL